MGLLLARVFVPTVAGNATELRPFETSLIRASELFIDPLYKHYEKKLMGEDETLHNDCADMLPLTHEEMEAEKEILAKFSERQKAICTELKLRPDEWWEAPPPAQHSLLAAFAFVRLLRCR